MTKLTLKKPLSFETQERLMKLKGGSDGAEKQNNNKKPQAPSEAQIVNIGSQEKSSKEDRAKAKERFHETKSWLESTYPEALNFNEPKPLKLGIERDLLDSSSPYSKSQLRKCLRVYCASRGYLKAIAKENWRYDLNGEKVGGIIQEHKDYALKQLEYNRGAVK